MSSRIFNEAFFTAVGVVFLILGFIALFNGVFTVGISGILWFSYTALLLIGLGLVTRNSYLIASQFNIVFIPYIFWTLDFLYVLTTGNSLWGMTDYVFQARPLLSQFITMQHLFMVPVSLLALYHIKIKRKDFWKFSLIQVSIFFFLVRILGQVDKNVDCVFKNCITLQVIPGPYPLVWFVGYFIMICVTSILLIWLFSDKKTKKETKKH